MRYIVKGYTGPYADFTDEVEADAADLPPCHYGDPRYSEAWNRVKEALLDTSMPGDYLDVFDLCDFERREDLADSDTDIVLVAEAYGCDNCQEKHDCNNWTDGCDDSPHGGYMLVFTPAKEAV